MSTIVENLKTCAIKEESEYNQTLDVKSFKTGVTNQTKYKINALESCRLLKKTDKTIIIEIE